MPFVQGFRITRAIVMRLCHPGVYVKSFPAYESKHISSQQRLTRMPMMNLGPKKVAVFEYSLLYKERGSQEGEKGFLKTFET